ncbi:hypothetical protein F4809DRAFT_453525 [Biscogniauxia mediterranea]|nr:hypothetical protein F4809DRAFT_453525 [Biscogniauxia mediterranea]
MPLKIVICGGGIGGLSAAGYLRAQHDVTVLERGNLDFATNDYGLSIVSNAFTLLQKAGIKSENLDTVVMTHLWVRDHEGNEVNSTHFDTRPRFGGAPSVLVKRAKLQEELMRFATSNEFPGTPAKIIQNAKVARVDSVAGKVWTDDDQVYEADLIIGADGINSAVRSSVFPGKGTPRSHDLVAFITRVMIEDIKSEPTFAYLIDPTSQAGLSNAQRGPHSKKRILLYHTSARDIQVLGYTSEGELAEKFDSQNTGIIKDIPTARVVEEFSSEFADNLVSLFRHGKIDAWRVRDIVPMDTWIHEKVVLIGDAAHAVTQHAGQGCNVTIEDAEALGHLLRDASPEDIPAVLKKFMSLRKDRVDLVARRSRQLGNIQSEEDKAKDPISGEEFAKAMYGYQGVEQFLKQSTQTL